MKQKMRRGIFLYFLMLAIGLQAATIQGIVVDESRVPMPFVTITVLDGDSALLTGTITGEDGRFTVEAPASARWLSASYMGYQRTMLELSVERPEGCVGCREIVLHEESELLREVVVTGNAQLVERHMDKIVMNVAASPFAIGSNGKDILRKAPGVNIDRKGRITVNGKAVEIYLDGRPTYLSGEQLKTMLETTDGSTIDRIEVITQPSSRYDAAGQGGIIHIRTKRNKSRGLNGSLSASYGGMYWRDIRQYMQDEQLSLSLNYRGEKTYTSLALTQTWDSKVETFDTRITTPSQERLTHSETLNRHPHLMLKAGNDWYIDTVNTFGFQFSAPVTYGRGYGDPARNSSMLTQDGKIAEETSEESRTRDTWLQHTANLHYTHTFDKALERELSVQAEYNRNNMSSEARYTMLSPGSTETIDQLSHHVSDIANVRLDFETAFWQTGKIECGAKWLSTRTAYATETDSFTYTEHIGALYLTAGKAFGEHWSTKLGLRGEWAITPYRQYLHLFPTAFAQYMPTPDWSMSLHYTRRIQRPTAEMLNPTERRESPHSIRVGDPQLRPALTHNVTASFGYSQYVSLDFDFAHTRDWQDYRTTILHNGDTYSQAANYGTQTSHGIYLSLTELPLVPKFSSRDADGKREVTGAWLALSAYIGANREAYRSYDGQLDMRQWSGDVYAELSAYLPHDWTLSVDGFYSTPSVWGTERLSAWREMNMAVKKDFPQQGLTLTVRVNDLLLSSDWSSEQLGMEDGCTNRTFGNDRAHQLTVGLTWKFGTMLDMHPVEDEPEPTATLRKSRRGRH